MRRTFANNLSSFSSVVGIIKAYHMEGASGALFAAVLVPNR
jgi:hypothetical protein